MLYDFSRMNVEQTRRFLSDTYNRRQETSSDMLMRVRITRRVLSILYLHPSWNEDDVFQRVQDSFRKGKGSIIVRMIDRELYDYFRVNWLDIIKLEPIKEGKEFEHYAKWSNVRLTKDEYIAKARAKWGDAYDYSESIYKAALSSITIRCIKHNYYFTVQAGNHIQMSRRQILAGGCPLCAQERVKEQRKIKHEETLKRKEERRIAKENSILGQVERCRVIANKQHGKQDNFIRKAKQLYPGYDYSKVEYVDRDKRITVGCPKHGFFSITPRTLIRGTKGKPAHGCWKCYGTPEPVLNDGKSPLEVFKKNMVNLYGDKYEFHWEDYKNLDSLVRFTCKLHGEQTRRAKALKNGNGCLYCSGKFYPPDWIKNAKAIHGDKYEYDESKLPKTQDSYIRYKCPVHGWQMSRYDCHVVQGCGCPVCANYTNKLSNEQRKQIWLKRCEERFNDRFDYSKFDYVNNDTKGVIYCREHHYSFMVSPDTHIRGAGGCPYCVGSIGEVHIRTWLENHHISFEPQFKIPNENLFCKRQYLCVDFYLPRQNMIIEMNGEQHYRYIDYFHNTKGDGWSFEDQQIRDDTLRTYCKEHCISLLEIKYNQVDDIPTILTKTIKLH